MAKDWRISRGGQRLDYTCENRRFATNIKRGQRHCPRHKYKGSVFGESLAQDGDSSFWFEHVIDKENPTDQCYWFMWYKDGKPTIPMSGILHREDVAKVARLLASLLP